MVFLWLPVAIALPTLSGWLLLRALEHKSPVLFRFERIALGFVLGMTLTMFVTFLLQVLGLILFTMNGFLIAQVLLLLITGGLYWKFAMKPTTYNSQPTTPFTALQKSLIALLSIWTIIKISAGIMILVSTPAYQDDVFNNWNMRGKLFYETKEMTLEMQIGNEITSAVGVSSYPPALPLIKTWLATLAGDWHEGLANSIHVLWFLSALLLVYELLKRRIGRLWALGGVYILSSLPLFQIHGVQPYADMMVSVHLFAAVGMLFLGASETDAGKRSAYLRIAALATGVMIFTKNETLIMHLPPLIVALFAMMWMRRDFKPVAHYALSLLLIGLPWIAYKWMHDLPFGNAKSVSGLELSWQKDVGYAIWINTFFEGNWALFFPIFFGLLAVYWRKALFTPLGILTGFFLMVYLGQMPLYFFTGLSTEVINQTGYARGLVQLMPVAACLVTLLIYEIMGTNQIQRDKKQDAN
ncbi:MAG: hypothetical protein O2904_04380 [bacterium]|nr:hypothetical protein [bacterium]